MANDILKISEDEYFEYLLEQYHKGLLDEGTTKILYAHGYLSSHNKQRPERWN